MAFGTLSVKGQALRYLAQREHSRAELTRKLARKVGNTKTKAKATTETETETGTGTETETDSGTPSASEQIEAALDELTSHGLLSEERAAASVLNTQGQRFGERRLKHSLQAKGFAPDLVASTLAQARGGELERARAVWQRKFGAPPLSAAERGKHMRFLMGRGFTGEVATRVLRDCGAPPDDAV
jgi:regulatory protein